MKKFMLEFIRRGLVACGFGPIVLAVVYLVLREHAGVQMLPVSQVCVGIFSLFFLAFIAGGMNAIYQFERLPLMLAILIHGGTLYISYLATFLINDWLELGIIPVVVFTAIFVIGYLVIWAVIYSIVKRNTKKVNEALKQKQRAEEP